MTAALLILCTVLLAGPVPRLLARMPSLRRTPGTALLVWQAVTLSAIIAALLAAPATLPTVLFDGQALWQHAVIMIILGGISLVMVGRFLLAGHRIGRRIRAARNEHRDVIDIIATQDEDLPELRVLDYAKPTAYCLPGRGEGRVVISRGVFDALTGREVSAVLAHERAHLTARHDLLIEFFTVIHETVPDRIRAKAAMREVRLLVEILADRSAARRVGTEPVIRALDVLAEGSTPVAAMGASAAATAPLRISLLRQGNAHPLRALGVGALAVSVLLIPPALALLAWR